MYDESQIIFRNPGPSSIPGMRTAFLLWFLF